MKIKGEKIEYFQEFLPTPEYLMVEPTNLCNLRCITCSRETLSDIGSMNFNTFKKVVDQFPNLKTVKFHGLGEPLLSPEAFPMLEYLNKLSCHVVIVSNAQWDNMEVKTLLGYLDHIYISVSSAHKEGYEGYTKGGSWDRLIKNVRRIMQHKTSKTDVVFNFVCTKKNYNS